MLDDTCDCKITIFWKNIIARFKKYNWNLPTNKLKPSNSLTRRFNVIVSAVIISSAYKITADDNSWICIVETSSYENGISLTFLLKLFPSTITCLNCFSYTKNSLNQLFGMFRTCCKIGNISIRCIVLFYVYKFHIFVILSGLLLFVFGVDNKVAFCRLRHTSLFYFVK